MLGSDLGGKWVPRRAISETYANSQRALGKGLGSLIPLHWLMGSENWSLVIGGTSPFEFHYTHAEESVRVLVDKHPTSSSFKAGSDAEILCQDIVSFEKEHCPWIHVREHCSYPFERCSCGGK